MYQASSWFQTVEVATVVQMYTNTPMYQKLNPQLNSSEKYWIWGDL